MATPGPAQAPGTALPAPGAEANPEGVHLHDGFYFRFGLGPAFIGSGTITPPGYSKGVDVSGAGVGVELAFGGTVTSGLVVGGGIYGQSFPSPSYSSNGVSFTGGGAVASSIGPFFDWYPNPTQGLHVQGAIGLAVISAGHGDTFPPNDEGGNGFSILAGIGYEWWIGPQLSLGVTARFQYENGSVKASGDTDSTSVSLFMPALVIGLTYH